MARTVSSRSGSTAKHSVDSSCWLVAATWRTESTRPNSLPPGASDLSSARFSPDSRWLLLAYADGPWLLLRLDAAARTFALHPLVARDGNETGAWMSLTIAAHELIYVADYAGLRGRLHHLAFFVDTREEVLRAADLMLDAEVPIEAAPSKHGVAQGFFLYGFEPGGNRIEVTTGGYFVYDPDHEPVIWTQAERERGQFWGVQTVESFHTYGTPPVAGDTAP